MGQAKAPIAESNLEEFIPKSDFPKLKTKTLSGDVAQNPAQTPAPVVSVDQKKSLNFLPAGIFLIILLVQLALMFYTIYLIRDFKNNVMASQTKQVTPGQAKKVFVFSDFNRAQFKTNIKTGFSISPDSDSARSLKINLDQEEFYGTSGNSLRVDYQFDNPNLKPGIIEFYLPQTDIRSYKTLSLQLKSEGVTRETASIAVQLKDFNGNLFTFRTGANLTSEWKKYETNLKDLSIKYPDFVLVSIRFLITPESHQSSGTFFLDDIIFES